jgi:predicted enzyme related to lactoylglutathione lyase
MSERDTYEPGVPCWVDTMQPDAERAQRFYGGLFGWEFDGPGQMPSDPPGRYFVARKRGRDVAGIATLPAGNPAPLPDWNTHVSVASADQASARAAAAGGAVHVAPFDVPPVGRMAVLGDPAGATFCVWEPRGRSGAQLVNEHSAWAMSALETPDPAGSERFYGELFGWTGERFTFGDASGMLFRLPGYVGGEPHQPVPRDVVAVMFATDGGPARWSVDFWIADADGAAAAVPGLGGTIVAPPHDRPGFRSAVVADPQGATFSISTLRM